MFVLFCSAVLLLFAKPLLRASQRGGLGGSACAGGSRGSHDPAPLLACCAAAVTDFVAEALAGSVVYHGAGKLQLRKEEQRLHGAGGSVAVGTPRLSVLRKCNAFTLGWSDSGSWTEWTAKATSVNIHP